MENNLSNYKGLLQGFKDQGYDFIFFKDEIKQDGQLILRHDIDFDTGYALKAARIESELNVYSTYFFMLRCPFYNMLSPESYDDIRQIKEMGHEVSIHFDPTIYDDFEKGLELERHFFKSVFDKDIDFISLHRPNDFFLKYNKSIGDVEHTYMSKYFQDIKYISDSTGKWRYGHPYTSDAFQSGATIHLLIHPLWWFLNGETNMDKLKEYWFIRTGQLQQDFIDNSKPFRDIVSELG